MPKLRKKIIPFRNYFGEKLGKIAFSLCRYKLLSINIMKLFPKIVNAFDHLFHLKIAFQPIHAMLRPSAYTIFHSYNTFLEYST